MGNIVTKKSGILNWKATFTKIKKALISDYYSFDEKADIGLAMLEEALSLLSSLELLNKIDIEYIAYYEDGRHEEVKFELGTDEDSDEDEPHSILKKESRLFEGIKHE